MNSIGKIFKVTTWGESHGPAIGAVVDGCPAGLVLSEDEISRFLKRNDRPLEETATARKEPNDVEIFSGLFREKTIGTPISLVIRNRDVRSMDYNLLDNTFRPGHGDYTYHVKYHTPTIPGGGRASGRECIGRLAAGYIAEKVIQRYYPDFAIESYITKMAGVDIHDDTSRAAAMDHVRKIKEQGDSSGGTIRLLVKGIPPGTGEPVFGALDASIASALMSIGGVKAVGIGSAENCADTTGSRFNDQFCIKNRNTGFVTNNNGGILSGISSGADIVVTISVKPTPSIGIPQAGATISGKLKEITVNGRHDANITPRVAPVAVAMLALVLVDSLMFSGGIGKDSIDEN